MKLYINSNLNKMPKDKVVIIDMLELAKTFFPTQINLIQTRQIQKTYNDTFNADLHFRKGITKGCKPKDKRHTIYLCLTIR